MAARDPHRFVEELDLPTLQRLIDRLEHRAQYPVFTDLLDRYVTETGLARAGRILEIGCGTGAVLRRITQVHGFSGEALGIDHCKAFIDVAREEAKQAGLSPRLRFEVGDAHKLELAPASFDVVLLHTVLSHVTDPGRVLKEASRVVRPGGTVVIFEGDYASLTYACPDHRFGQEIDMALTNATFNNPRIVRDLARLLPVYRLSLRQAWGNAVAEIGSADYFRSFAETYAPTLKQAATLPTNAVDVWLAEQRRAIGEGTFFAVCNYYTFVAERLVESDIAATP
jgi:SAM-dependent methyltransferase